MDIKDYHPRSGEYLDKNSKVHNVVDEVTGALAAITSDHLMVHRERAFSVAGTFAAVGDAASVNYAFLTPDVDSGAHIHLKYKEITGIAGPSGQKIKQELYEAPTNVPTGGSDLTISNRNRNSEVISKMQAAKTAMTIDTTGATLLENNQFTAGIPRSLDMEWILKPNTWYIRVLTNSTGGATDIDFFDFWYEEL